MQCTCYTKVWRGLACFVFGYASTSRWNSVNSTLFSYFALHLKIMKKIKLYIAASIDGYIARSDGDLDWLTKYPINSDTNYGYDDFYKPVDIVIMGGKTYRDILNMDFVWPYKDKTTYVITHNPMGTNENVHFITENVVEEISKLRIGNGKDIWLVGGGQLITILLNQDMVDEMTITTIPILLGNGIPLFPDNPKESQWELQNSMSYKNGVVQTKYKIKV